MRFHLCVPCLVPFKEPQRSSCAFIMQPQRSSCIFQDSSSSDPQSPARRTSCGHKKFLGVHYFWAVPVVPRGVYTKGLVPQAVHTKRFGEQVARTCPKNSNWFEFLGLVVGIKVGSCDHFLNAKMASSRNGTCPRDLLQGLVLLCVPEKTNSAKLWKNLLTSLGVCLVS